MEYQPFIGSCLNRNVFQQPSPSVKPDADPLAGVSVLAQYLSKRADKCLFGIGFCDFRMPPGHSRMNPNHHDSAPIMIPYDTSVVRITVGPGRAQLLGSLLQP